LSYTAEITRTSPTCFLFMIDQSLSMAEAITGGSAKQQKADGVADSINHWLRELSLKCAKADGVGDYYHVGVIGYGGNVGPAFVGPMAGRDLIPISEIAENPGRIEKRQLMIPDAKGKLKKQNAKVPVWFDPIADGGTPMCGAMTEAHRILQDWLNAHGNCYPPHIIHITDGEATDGNPEQRVHALTQLSSSDGPAMLFNIHLSSNPKAKPIVFPDSANGLPDDYSRMLWKSASLLTPNMRAVATEQGYPTTEMSRAFVLNADMVALVQAIDIGTRAAIVATEPPIDSFLDASADEAADYEDAGQEDVGQEDVSREDAGRKETNRDGAGYADEPAQDVAADTAPAVPEVPEAPAPATITVKMTVLATGETVDAKIQTDKAGGIKKIVPSKPLDPSIEYRVGPELR
jgi:hypothetical protein